MSKGSLVRAVILLLGALIVPVSVSGQSSHTLQGKVMLSNGAPPPNSVRVRLTFNGMNVYETFTDLGGRFSFSGLHRGMYQLIAEGDDQTFETTRVNAEVAAYGSA